MMKVWARTQPGSWLWTMNWRSSGISRMPSGPGIFRPGGREWERRDERSPGLAAGSDHPRSGAARHGRIGSSPAPSGMDPNPILILSVRDREDEKVRALDNGADDYVTKPFGIGELLARMRVALRKSIPPSPEPVYKVDGLEVDFEHRRVTAEGKEVQLTPPNMTFCVFWLPMPEKC